MTFITVFTNVLILTIKITIYVVCICQLCQQFQSITQMYKHFHCGKLSTVN